jgi:hypothetical protein
VHLRAANICPPISRITLSDGHAPELWQPCSWISATQSPPLVSLVLVLQLRWALPHLALSSSATVTRARPTKCFAFPYSLVVLSMTVMLYTAVPSSSAGVHPKCAPTPTSLAGHAHLQPAQRLEQQRRLPSGEKVGGVGRQPNSTCTPPLVNTTASTLLLTGFALDGIRGGGLYSTLMAPSLAHAPLLLAAGTMLR